MFKKVSMVLAVLVAFAVGFCVAKYGFAEKTALEKYIAECKYLAMEAKESDMPANSLAGSTLTSREYKATYNVVFANADYLSFRANEYSYEGGAHGSTKITVGTICRKTWKRLKLSDVVAPEKMNALGKLLRAKAIEKVGGETNLQGEVKPIENFYIAADGLHFVYNEYEIACYAQGAVEVVVSPGEL